MLVAWLGCGVKLCIDNYVIETLEKRPLGRSRKRSEDKATFLVSSVRPSSYVITGHVYKSSISVHLVPETGDI